MWLKQLQFIVSQFRRLEVRIPGVGRGRVPLTPVGDVSLTCLFQLQVPPTSLVLRQDNSSLTWRSPSVSSPTPSSVCVCVHISLLLKTAVTWIRAHLSDLIWPWPPVQRPYNQIRSHGEMPGLGLQRTFLWGRDSTPHSGQSINNMTWKVTH